MAGVETEPAQFRRGYQSELPHGCEASRGRRSTEIVERPLDVLIAFMDECIQFQIAVMRRQGVVVAYGSAFAQDSLAESVQCDHPNLLKYPPIGL